MRDKNSQLGAILNKGRLCSFVIMAILPLTVLLTSCSSSPVLLTALGTQEGLASYYSNELQGRKTSTGEIFDNSLLTAAHRTYPFGTKVRVTNMATKESIEVRINDRGPRKPERIIDLTELAAKKIGIYQAGLGRVRVEVLEWGEAPKKGKFSKK